MKKPKFTIWLTLTVIFGFTSVLFVLNIIEPFPDKARSVVSFQSSPSGQDIALDAKGNVVNNWQSPNYVGNSVKVLLGVLAVGSDIMLFRASLQKFDKKIVTQDSYTVAQ